MRVLVCGSRDYTDDWPLRAVLEWVCKVSDLTVIHGAAPGADSQFGDLASLRGAEVIEYPADWDKHGKAAGPIRNQQMLDEGKPEVVIAFVNKPLVESRGTNDMVQRARRAGLPVYVFEGAS
jgi:hypothetical protein